MGEGTKDGTRNGTRDRTGERIRDGLRDETRDGTRDRTEDGTRYGKENRTDHARPRCDRTGVDTTKQDWIGQERTGWVSISRTAQEK